MPFPRLQAYIHHSCLELELPPFPPYLPDPASRAPSRFQCPPRVPVYLCFQVQPADPCLRPEVVESSILELEVHSLILDLM